MRTPSSARSQRTIRLGVGGSMGFSDEATTFMDGDESANWHLSTGLLQERKLDDSFRLSHTLDDRLRKEFPALHACTTAGEHSGWMTRPGSGTHMKHRNSDADCKEPAATKTGEAGKDDYLRAEESDDDGQSSESSIDLVGFKATFQTGPNPNGIGNAGGQKGGKNAGAAGRSHHRGSSEGPGGRNAYSMQAATEIQPLPVLTMNHAHASRFRSMRLDAQTQAYLREKKDVLRVVRYQCPVCSVNHEFRVQKSAAGHQGGAEHQH